MKGGREGEREIRTILFVIQISKSIINSRVSTEIIRLINKRGQERKVIHCKRGKTRGGRNNRGIY